MSSRKKNTLADSAFQDVLTTEFSSAKELRSNFSKKCRKLDKRIRSTISNDDFRDWLDQYDLEERTLDSLETRFQAGSNKIDYPAFIDHAVSLYIKGAGDDIDDLDDVEELDDDDDSSSSSRNKSRSKSKSNRTLPPTVDEDLLTQLENNFSTPAVLTNKMSFGKDAVTESNLLSSAQFKRTLKECSLALKSSHVPLIFDAFGGKTSKRKLDFEEFLNYCVLLHPGKRSTNRRRSMRGSEIDELADELRRLIQAHRQPNRIFDEFKQYDDEKFITPTQFMKSISRLFPNESFSKSELKRLMDRFDHDGDGIISRTEFHEFLNLDDIMSKERKKSKKRRTSKNSDSDDDNEEEDEEERRDGRSSSSRNKRRSNNSDSDDNNDDDDDGELNPGTELTSSIRDQLFEAYNEDRSIFTKTFKSYDKNNTGIIKSDKFKIALAKIVKSTTLTLKSSDISFISKTYYGKSRSKEIQYKLFIKLCKGDYKMPKKVIKREVGDKILAKIVGWTEYYPGKIVKVRMDGTYDITFDDGEKKKSVQEKYLKKKNNNDESEDDDNRPKRRNHIDSEDDGDRSNRSNRSNRSSNKRRSNNDSDEDSESEPNPGHSIAKSIRRKLATHYNEYVNEFKTLFKPHDKKKTGIIKSNKFKDAFSKFAKDTGLKLTSTEISKISRAYKDSNKDIRYEQFLALCRNDYVKPPARRTVGDTVRAKCQGWDDFFSGTITKVKDDGTYDITFEDGEKKKSVREKEIKGTVPFVDSDDSDLDQDSSKKKRGRSDRSDRSDRGVKRNESEDDDEYGNQGTRRVGDRVEAKCRGWDRHFPGKITKVRLDGTYDITFEDGEKKESVNEDVIKGNVKNASKRKSKDFDEDEDDRSRNRNSSSRTQERRVGDRIEAKCTGWNRHFGGKITKVNSDGTFGVTFEDGEKKKYVEEREIKGNPGGDDDEDVRSSRSNRSSRKSSRTQETLRKLRKFYRRAVDKGRARDYREIFETMDSNRDGEIDAREFTKGTESKDVLKKNGSVLDSTMLGAIKLL